MCITIYKVVLIVFIIFCSENVVWGQNYTLKGRVVVEGQKKIKNIIIYLEATEDILEKDNSRKHKVSQKGRIFKPDLIIIKQGDVMQWMNDEDREIDHNVYSLSPIQRFDLGLGERGSVLEKNFNGSGRVNYFCSVHKMMEGRVIILPTRNYYVLDQPGKFILAEVPKGEWWLKAIVFHRRYTFDKVKIKVGKDPINNLIVKITKK